MNPFLHDTVARPASRADFPADPYFPLSRRARRRRQLAGVIGRLAAAGSLALTVSSAYAIDVNSASAEQLEAVRGVGAKTARIIVQERQRGGSFESIEDLSDRVRGIGPKRAQALQAAGLTVGAGSPPASANQAASASSQTVGASSHKPAASRHSRAGAERR